MQNLPNEIIDKIYSHTDIAVCIRDKQYYALSQFPEVTIDWAAENGHLEVVKYLHEIGKECTDDAIDRASKGGHLEIVKYLHEVVGANCTTKAMEWAAEDGHLDIVKYLHEAVGAKCNSVT